MLTAGAKSVRSGRQRISIMLVTILLGIMMMAGLFLLLLGGVGFIQQKKFFSSAPQEVQDVVPDSMPERFAGQYAVGWVMIIVAIFMMLGAMVLGAWDGIENGFTFWQFFVRFLVMILMLKAYDILFFDWVLLCNAGFNFFPHFYPETKDMTEPEFYQMMDNLNANSLVRNQILSQITTIHSERGST